MRAPFSPKPAEWFDERYFYGRSDKRVLFDPRTDDGRWSAIAQTVAEVAWASGRHITTMLDAGCGVTACAEELGRLGYDACGADWSEFAIRTLQSEAEEPFRYTCASLDALPWPDRYFHLTFSWYVLEHVPEPAVPRTLAELRRVTSDILALVVAVAEQESALDGDLSHCTVRPRAWWRQ